MHILITGLAGFIGHHVADHFLQTTDATIVGLDAIDMTTTLHRLRFIKDWPKHAKRVGLVWHDLHAPINDMVREQLLQWGPIDAIFHLAASTHVDRSIDRPDRFLQTNVFGTYHILELARQLKPQLFLYFSTDEIFGPAPEGVAYGEWDRARPGNPYAATKSAGEDLTIAYQNTYKINAIVTHCMNVVGPRQHPEKFLPKVAGCVYHGHSVPIHTDPTRTKPGTRCYLSAKRVARALQFLLDRRDTLGMGDKFNIVGEREIDNLTLAQTIAGLVGKPLDYELMDFHSLRPGHDLRYALDGTKMAAMGFNPANDLDATIEASVKFCLAYPREWM